MGGDNLFYLTENFSCHIDLNYFQNDVLWLHMLFYCYLLLQHVLMQDAANCNGGKWIIRFKKVVSGRFWEDLVSNEYCYRVSEAF